ncbi:uncharacterized protein CCOS01_05858 [Colletotrichum costaricense]|uniref:Nephrocystin 3-like N-terminal domain-containing protein n=1 Tax=Colletotrichum costaricense TaxID=1209916 RepID=A0AAI9Z1E4_9PEZI|nr:uncharacterized protein CCOS01_05858 [Colletotrichum costaricense]KAK1530755.1 hypothetical protein CCOS01_05858 [Colletotrichum costaricense]
MSDTSRPGGSALPIRLQTPVVDFIDNRLPRYHPAFEYPERFHDGNGNRLVAISSGWSSPTSSNHTVPFVPSDQAAKSKDLACPAVLSPRPSQQAARPLPPSIEDMTFWGLIWPKAMDRLRETPEASGREDKGFSIREAEKWADVTNTLDRARDKYNGIRTDDKCYHKVLGKIKRSSRRVGETVATPLQQVIKVVPSHPIATPVLGTLDLLLKAWKEAAKIRTQLDASFDEDALASKFEDLEVWSSLFRNDENIAKASANLVVSILKAAEGAIGFYISWQVSRLRRSIFQGDEYLHSFVESLNEIQKAGDRLQSEVDKSHKYQENTQTSSKARLLLPFEEGSELSVESRTPTPEPRVISPPEVAVSPEELVRSLDGTRTDEEDMAFILDRATAFSAEDRGRAEEVVETREFRNWVTSNERSSLGDGALLIHGDYDLGDYPEISPLSALCVAFVQILRTRHEYIGLVFFCGRHLETPQDSNPGPTGLMRSLIAQLVRQHPAVFTQMQEPRISLEDIRETQNNLSYLISLFAAMIRQIPVSNTVFVLLDGVLFKSGRNKDKRLEYAIQEAQGYPVYEKYAKYWKGT